MWLPEMVPWWVAIVAAAIGASFGATAGVLVMAAFVASARPGPDMSK